MYYMMCPRDGMVHRFEHARGHKYSKCMFCGGRLIPLPEERGRRLYRTQLKRCKKYIEALVEALKTYACHMDGYSIHCSGPVVVTNTVPYAACSISLIFFTEKAGSAILTVLDKIHRLAEEYGVPTKILLAGRSRVIRDPTALGFTLVNPREEVYLYRIYPPHSQTPRAATHINK